MILAVDFDGTIARSSFPDILGEQPYAGEVLRKLQEATISLSGPAVAERTCLMQSTGYWSTTFPLTG